MQGRTRAAKSVFVTYKDALEKLGTEFDILLDTDTNVIQDATTSELADAIRCMRNGDLEIRPGYDGEFGKVQLRIPPRATQKRLAL